MRSRALLALLLLLCAACGRMPVRDEITLQPSEHDDTVTVTVSTDFWLSPPTDEMLARVETARAAALANTDPWSVRFGRLNPPHEERHIVDKVKGKVRGVTRSARMPSDDLQHLFSDANVTVDVVRGEGWRELRLYPGSDGRATREQRQKFEETLQVWSRSVTRYFTAMHQLYAYLDRNPHRAEAVFAAMFEEENAAAIDEETELPLIQAVGRSMTEINDRMETTEQQSEVFELAELVFNPFPGRVVVRPPRDILSVEGFEQKGNEVLIDEVDLFASLKGLEGRWISPDPFAASLREHEMTAKEMAEAERRSTATVDGNEVTRAIREQLTKPKAYVVRWRD
ncbi:MAG TPA: hypothetical protein VNI54_17365 [Thermoanaerobaculia bacterium]|nr:hypothetical protein [Thermoanaerobaculia bacterium]